MIKINYQNKELLESISFITFGSDQTQLTFSNEAEELSLVLKFVDDFKNETPRYEFRSITEKAGEFTLINMNHPIGLGLKEPLKIGEMGNRELFITFFVKKIPESKSKKVVISLYLGAGVRHGQN